PVVSQPTPLFKPAGFDCHFYLQDCDVGTVCVLRKTMIASSLCFGNCITDGTLSQCRGRKSSWNRHSAGERGWTTTVGSPGACSADCSSAERAGEQAQAAG